jgi:hypothetical protein
MRRYLMLVMLVVLVMGMSAAANVSLWPTVADSLPIVVAAEMYVWYGMNANGTCVGGLGSSHWNDTIDTIVKDTPRLGFYCSADKGIINAQLVELHDVGVSVLFVSFWGDQKTTVALKNLLNVINMTSAFSDWFRVAVLVEEQGISANQVWAQFYEPYLKIMFLWEGKPLLLYFNQPKPLPDPRFTIRTLGVKNDPDWDFWHGTNLTGKAEDFNSSEYQGEPRISSDGVLTVIPRFDDYALHMSGSRPYYQVYDPTLTEGMYGNEWTYAFQHRPEIRMIIINSYNELHERTNIQPTLEDGMTLLVETGAYVAELDEM